jgi:hypothetical protein
MKKQVRLVVAGALVGLLSLARCIDEDHSGLPEPTQQQGRTDGGVTDGGPGGAIGGANGSGGVGGAGIDYTGWP